MLYLFLILPLVAPNLAINLKDLMGAASTLKNTTSSKCWNDLFYLLQNIRLNKNSWSLKMIDATFKLPAGILKPNSINLGDFGECISINAKVSSKEILGKYCLGFLKTKARNQKILSLFPEKIRGLIETDNFKKLPRFQGIPLAFCLPDGCDGRDLNAISGKIFKDLISSSISITFDDRYCQTIKDINKPLDFGAIATLYIILILIVVVIVASLKHKSINGRNPSTILQCFSIHDNWSTLFSVTPYTPNQIPCLEGLKFFSCLWVVLGHQGSLLTMYQVANPMTALNFLDSEVSMFFTSAFFAVDTFLTIFGILLAYRYFQLKARNIKVAYVWFCLYRFVKLTPSFLIVILVTSNLLNYFGSGPRWPFIATHFVDGCRSYWWTALLYIQNYTNPQNMCIAPSWYLCADIQLFVLSPIILESLWKKPKTCLHVLIFSLGVLSIFNFINCYYNEVPAIYSYKHFNKIKVDMYYQTHNRLCSWIIGILFGYLFFKIKQKQMDIKIRNIKNIIGWIICLGTLLGCVVLGHDSLGKAEFNSLNNALHITLTKPLWALCIGWICLSCVLNNGGIITRLLSFPVYQVSSRLIYGIYLVHYLILGAKLFQRPSLLEFNVIDEAFTYWGVIFYSFLGTVVLALFIDLPILSIMKLLIRKHTQRGACPQKPFVPLESNLKFV